MRSITFLSILHLLIIKNSSCWVFSAASSTARTKPTEGTNAFRGNVAPFRQIKRTNLKRQIEKAAAENNESLVISLVNELSRFNDPTFVPTRGLLGYNGGDPSNAPLNGKWKLLYTNAKDAEAPARTKKNPKKAFGNEVADGIQVKTGQRIDAATGECVNFIKLTGEKRPFDQLEITIQMAPLSDTRVRLDFLKGRALNEKALPFLRDFRFSFPPPVLNDLIAILRGKDPKVEPQTYFDVLYLDQDFRAHRTGEGKYFVQKRDRE
mmetsp:Transcript_11703/g.21897  ORF Transcript_11703/g.21897 Transcript_11703/m.21897 type:complete len:265 (+) Transcript_11703:130-924(+)